MQLISMDGKGRATDNSCIERFWRSAKCERIYLNEYHSISELITDVDDYIENIVLLLFISCTNCGLLSSSLQGRVIVVEIICKST
jgi:transposase InsO family protein